MAISIHCQSQTHSYTNFTLSNYLFMTFKYSKLLFTLKKKMDVFNLQLFCLKINPAKMRLDIYSHASLSACTHVAT